MPQVTSAEHRAAADALRRLAAVYRSAEDLITIGAYADGTNPEIDRAKAAIGEIRAFLRQGSDEPSGWDETVPRLRDLARTVAA